VRITRLDNEQNEGETHERSNLAKRIRSTCKQIAP
jgi:hypothetical protein